MKTRKIINRVKKVIKHPTWIILGLASKNIIKMDDRTYIEKLYRLSIGKKLNLDNPKTFNEKLQWLKLYNRKPEYTKMVDKYEVRKYISEKIGDEYLIPLIGVYDKFEEIDFDKLPEQFVIKCNHDSGSTIICKNKDEFEGENYEKK